MECPNCGGDSYDNVFGNCLDCECEEVNRDWRLKLEETTTYDSSAAEMDDISERSLDGAFKRLGLSSSNSRR